MDQHARFRSRGVRTIGRLTSPAADDVLLAQWPLPADSILQRQDVAISSEWEPKRHRPAIRHQQNESIDPIGLVDAYERHQHSAVRRLLEVVDAEIAGRDTEPVVFEPPTTLQSELLQAISACQKDGSLNRHLAVKLESRTIAAGELVARCWALIELYRSDLIAVDELQAKYTLIQQELETVPPLGTE